MGVVIPVSPKRFKKIKAVNAKLVNLDELPRYAGINPARAGVMVNETFGTGTYRPSCQNLVRSLQPVMGRNEPGTDSDISLNRQMDVCSENSDVSPRQDRTR